ncbi:recombinase family protein [Streptomyces sp. NPDC057445]|uniref:recombinase family protein n=1 Tax=Streptomyces sp. NPDC057445 TaxID=3346136 RepID=UPI0036BAFF03
MDRRRTPPRHHPQPMPDLQLIRCCDRPTFSVGRRTSADTLKITRLDRLSRSVLHLVTLGPELRDRGVGLHIIEHGIGTETVEGRAMFGMLRVLAELRRELIVATTEEDRREDLTLDSPCPARPCPARRGGYFAGGYIKDFLAEHDARLGRRRGPRSPRKHPAECRRVRSWRYCAPGP